MKVLCVSPSYWPAFQYGGPINSVHKLNKTLVKKGVDITVYTTNVGLENEITINKQLNLDRIKIIYFSYSNFFEFLGQTGWQFSWEMRNAIKDNIKNFDLLYIPAIWNYPTAIATYYCRKYKKPYIIIPKGSLYPYTLNKKKWKKWLYYNLISKRDIKGASLIYYATKDEFEKVHSFLGLTNRSVVISNGIDLSEFNDLPKKDNFKKNYPFLKDKKIILFLGRINWKKGLDILVKAFGKLAQDRDDVYLLIVGPDENGYINIVKKGLKSECALGKSFFTGLLKKEKKLEAFMGSDIFVLPSYSENFGIAVIEAMACNLPVIISNQVGISKEIESAKAGLIINTGHNELYDAFVKLLDNKKESLEMGKRGRKLVEKYFNIEKVADKTIKVFEEIIDEKL